MPPETPCYLVDLRDPLLGHIVESDITRYLENAIEQVYWHLAEYENKITVEVDFNGRELSGIGFFDSEGTLISSIAAYYLDRDCPDVTLERIKSMRSTRPGELRKGLQALFQR